MQNAEWSANPNQKQLMQTNINNKQMNKKLKKRNNKNWKN